MRHFRVYFYGGYSITIEGANYMDALQKSGIDPRKIVFYKEV